MSSTFAIFRVWLIILSFFGSFYFSYKSTGFNFNDIKKSLIIVYDNKPDTLAITESTDNKNIIFGGVKFSEPISSSLTSMGITHPSPIQSSSLIQLNTGMSAILHAETGSGKTLAYLLPLLKRLRLTTTGYHTTKPAIQAFIIVPTKELVLQVAADIISLTSSSSSSSSLASSNIHNNIVHLCISTNRQGFDDVTSPIVIGTPVKIVDAMKSSSANTFKSINYIVLDEVDRLLSVVGKYATTEEKRKANENENLTELILSNILWKVKKTEEERSNVQIIAVSATVGRPLRRQLSQIISGGNSYENFPVLHGQDILTTSTTSVNTMKNKKDNKNQNNDNDDDDDNNSISTSISSSTSNRKVSIPQKIKHVCILIDCESDDISTKIVKVKEKWNQLLKNDQNLLVKTKGNPSIPGISNQRLSRRGIIFVPKKSDVSNTVGMLKFWGLKECIDLQSALGLETNNNNIKPTSNNSNSHKKVTIKRQPEKTLSTTELIHLAQKNRLGVSNNNNNINNIQNAVTTTDKITNNSNNNQLPNQNDENENRLFVAPVVTARGLHLQDINVVFITYCPKTMDEYLHMAGRTGRLSNKSYMQSDTTTYTNSNSNNTNNNSNDDTADNTADKDNILYDNTVISLINFEELKRLQSWQVPLGIQLKILFD